MPSSSTASTVIDATRRTPLASSSTFAMASPRLMPVTRAGIRFRALILIGTELNGLPPVGWSARLSLSAGSRPTCHRPATGAGDQSGTRSSPNHAVVGAVLHAWSAHGLHELGSYEGGAK